MPARHPLFHRAAIKGSKHHEKLPSYHEMLCSMQVNNHNANPSYIRGCPRRWLLFFCWVPALIIEETIQNQVLNKVLLAAPTPENPAKQPLLPTYRTDFPQLRFLYDSHSPLANISSNAMLPITL